MPRAPLTRQTTSSDWTLEKQKQERRIDEALEETFPGSDPPAFVSGAIPGSHERSAKAQASHTLQKYGQPGVILPANVNGQDMAKKSRGSLMAELEETVSDMANAVSVAATGSEIGILELAAEDELRPDSVLKALPMKPLVRKKKVATETASELAKRKPARRRQR